MRYGLIAVIFLALSVMTGCLAAPKTATVYKYHGKTFLIISESNTVKNKSKVGKLFHDVTTTRLATLDTDGNVEIIAENTVIDPEGIAPLTYKKISPKGKKLLGADPIKTIDKYGYYIRATPYVSESFDGGIRIRNSELWNDSGKSGYLRIKPSELQVDGTKDQARAPAAQTNSENISTTPDTGPLAQIEKDGGD